MKVNTKETIVLPFHSNELRKLPGFGKITVDNLLAFLNKHGVRCISDSDIAAQKELLEAQKKLIDAGYSVFSPDGEKIENR